MAELQLALKYKPVLWRPLQVLDSVTKWTFLVVLPTLFIWLMYCLLLLPELAPWRYSQFIAVPWGVLCGYVALIFAGLVITGPFRNRRLEVSQTGLVLPFTEAMKNGFRSSVLWSDIKSVSVTTNDLNTAGNLLFMLDSGKHLSLKIEGFKPAALEQLLLAIELWGMSTIRTPELIDFQTRVHNATKGLQQNSYTEMWEEELARRFSATAFIPLEPGKTLQKGKLKVVRQLAFGGLSALYLVHENDTELSVIKEAVVPNYADENARREAEKILAREAQMLTRLDHPNLVKVKDYFVEAGRNYLLLEYIAGQDLRQLVRQTGPQDPNKVIEWCTQLADVLDYLHSLQPPIIHRDMTPDNVVLKIDGSVTLIDFGSANEFVGTSTGTIVGKQAYMAPEQLRGKSTHQTDLYALGATMFFLLTGRDPVPLSVSSPLQVVPSTPERVDAIVRHATAYESKDRIQNAAEFKEQLQDA